jgi:hypothetical protein
MSNDGIYTHAEVVATLPAHLRRQFDPDQSPDGADRAAAYCVRTGLLTPAAADHYVPGLGDILDRHLPRPGTADR